MRVISEFVKELFQKLREKVILSAWAFATLVLAIAGPFGNYSVMSFPERLVFWALLTTLGTLAGVAIALFLERRLGTQPYWPVSILSSLTLTVLMAPLLRWFSANFTRVTGEEAPGFGEVEALVFFLALGICSIQQIVAEMATRLPKQAMSEFAPSEAKPYSARLFKRIEPELHAPILWVSVRDHYVDIRTEAGQTSVLMRFADAIDELDGLVGLRVHRSHWVADAAVARVERDGAKLFLHTHDGQRFPVSKTYRDSVESRCYAKGHAIADAQA